MKQVSLFLMLFAVSIITFAQTETELFKRNQLAGKELISTALREQFLKKDFSKLWTGTENKDVYGFIGDNYQRIRVKFITVTKSISSPDTYVVVGKSMVKNNINEFHGIMKVLNVRRVKIASQGIEKLYKSKGIKGQFVMIGEYNFKESEKENHAGVFKGAFRTDFYLNKYGKAMYDNINIVSDSYKNNQFAGEWIQYNPKIVKTCNWGDYRIPNSGNLDTGVGEFFPANKYLKYGWQSRSNFFTSNGVKGKEIEEAKWWK